MKRSPLSLPGRGFTLVEVLVAMAIFAVVGVLAYGGYSESAKQAEHAREQMARLKEVQTAVRVMTQDFEQLAPRPVRDVLGQSLLPALNADSRSDGIVTLTRAGWSNPAGIARSTLQRVQYVLADGKLLRNHWTVLDTTLSNQPIQRELIKGVKQVRLRFVDRTGAMSEQWPPLAGQPQGLQRSRPLGVEVVLELDDLGTITRLIEVGG